MSSLSISQLLRKAADTSLEFGASLLSTQQPVRRKKSPTSLSPSPSSFSSFSSTTSRTKPSLPTPIANRKPIKDWVDLENSRHDEYFRLLRENEEHRAVYEASSRIPLPISSPDDGKKGKMISPRLEAKKADGSDIENEPSCSTTSASHSHQQDTTSNSPSTLSKETERELRDNEIIADRILRLDFDELEYTIAVMRLKHYKASRALEQEGEESSSQV